ncbi:hypothetical protein SEA_MISCHIEF19_40 [Streptomyces phage Mischief19]|nr:hypothetical protein SEA_MISCHIEF19_40 [Streptomyces phage Mischief19]
MIAFTGPEAKQMLKHTAEVMGDRIHHESGYTQGDSDVVTALDNIGRAPTSAVVLTGEECDDEAARALLREVIGAELRTWVPGASQRLIYRAANALGVRWVRPTANDHGPNAGDHPLVRDWIAGMPLLRCATCARLFVEG